jgi:hypothetical protein
MFFVFVCVCVCYIVFYLYIFFTEMVKKTNSLMQCFTNRILQNILKGFAIFRGINK